MLEGKRISELDLVTTLREGCCFPLISNGSTKRVTYGAILSQIENDLPDTGINQVKEDVAELKVKTEKIETLENDVKNIEGQVNDVSELIESQNTSIRNCVSKVEDLEQIIDDTHFDDVLELEAQVRLNTTNIESKQDLLTQTQLNAVNSGITAEKVAIYDAGNTPEGILNFVYPIGCTYVQYPNCLSPTQLFPSLTWQNISSEYAGNFFRAEGGNASEFNSGVQESCNKEEITSEMSENSSGSWGGTDGGYKGTNQRDNFTKGFAVSEFVRDFDGNGSYPHMYKVTANIEHTHTIGLGNTEARPRNMTIRIWKRVS